MTNKDKKIVSDYMGWKKAILSDGYHNMLNNRPVLFDLNDAGLIVKEMVKRGEWEDFVAFVEETPKNRESLITWNQLIAWLFSADNFFSAFVEWLKEGKK